MAPRVPKDSANSQPQPTGLIFRLSEGAPEGERPQAITAPPVTPLGDAEIERLLNRLPPPTREGTPQPFAFPERSLPAPRTGRNVPVTFPPDTEAAPPERGPAGALHVLRRSPEGDVPLAPNLSVTFDQPMVAVTSHDELAKLAVPVRLDPAPAGEWRWVGARTVVFEPTGRFPMATDFSVEVPAGTKSAIGGVLANAERWRFSTPPPALQSSRPADETVVPTPLMLAAFDQRIDPAAVLATISVRAGRVTPPLRLATSEEVQADEHARDATRRAGEGRWLAFTVFEPLPPDTPVTVAVGPGTPSTEGPKRTVKAQEWTFRTFGPFRIVRWREDSLRWGSLAIECSNPVGLKSFRKRMVQVEPEVPGLSVSAGGDYVQLHGAFRANSTYRVTVSASLSDAFGQALGGEVTHTVKTPPADPAFVTPGSNVVVLDPSGPPVYSVYTAAYASLEVEAYAVGPADWEAFRQAWMALQRDNRRPARLGTRLAPRTVKVAGTPDELVETRIDLSPWLRGGVGQIALFIRPASPARAENASGRRRYRGGQDGALVWVQATRLSLEAFVDAGRMVVYASTLADGQPLADTEVELWPVGTTARTGPDGVARMPLAASSASLLLARKGTDLALLPQSQYPWGEVGWSRHMQSDGARWAVFDDRQMYRPGEDVHFKGWVRRSVAGPAGDIAPLRSAKSVAYRIIDSRRNELTSGSSPLNRWGGFDIAFKVPAAANLGWAMLDLSADVPDVESGTARHSHGFQVQEFRTPEYEVRATTDEGPYFVGSHATATVTAAYYAGGALPGADVSWSVTASPGSFVPPNRDDFVFGRWTPWWELGSRSDEAEAANQRQSFAASTDSSGRHLLRVDFERVTPPRAMNVRAEATVQDVNRQAWSSGVNLLVHPASLYVGIRSRRPFVQKGQPITLDLIVTDLDGRAVVGRAVDVRAERIEWEQVGGEWTRQLVGRQDCRVPSGADPVPCVFHQSEGGQYEITAAVHDDLNRPNETVLRMWVAGGSWPRSRGVGADELTLVPNQKEYRPGDTAEILVIAPFAPAEGIVTLGRDGIVRTERFTLKEPSTTVRFGVEEAWTPNVHVQVELFGSALREGPMGEPDARLPRRPARAHGELDLDVSLARRALTVSALPRAKALEPGGETTVDATVLDSNGAPVPGAEVAIVVVDEAILSLSHYTVPAPLTAFYTHRGDGFSRHSLRDQVLLSWRPEAGTGGAAGGVVGGLVAETAMADMMPMAAPAEKVLRSGGAPAKDEGAAAPIRARTDFNPLAVFVPSVETDANGRVEARVKLPDNLTRYRVMAVAATDGNRFGSGESTLISRLPLMVRVSPPRFLNFGDRFELPVVLQNQTDQPLQADVAVRAVNAGLTSGRGRRVEVPANDRVEVRFPAATVQAGRAKFQVAAASGRWADASEVSLPVWTPATTEAFATYGEIDQGATFQPIRPPGGVVPQFGGLEITTSSTALQALTDAVLYLVAYPFECAEQLSSRVLAVAALKDVLAAFKAEGLPPTDELKGAVARDLKRLATLQNDDGGFAFWRRGDESWPYVSIHVAHAIARAKAKGFDVPDRMIRESLGYLANVERHIPGWYPAEAKQTLTAYALYVRQLLGDRDVGRARKLVAEATLPKLSFEAVGWLLSVMSGDPAAEREVTTIRTLLGSRVTETAGAAHFVVSYGDADYLLLHSDRRADAVLLEALIGDQPRSDLIPKLVTGLLAHRKAGRWTNTQENAFVLLALDRYFRTYEAATPDFVARVWLGDRFAGEHAFRGRTTDRASIDIPMSAIAGSAASSLALAKEGPGRLYYRIGMRYAPADLKLAPLDRGFTVERRYEAVDSAGDVARDGDGTWRIKAGARVRVMLTLAAEARRYHVALIDPLPAGLEAMNPALAVTGAVPEGRSSEVDVVGAPGLGSPGRPGAWWWWRRSWFEHQNLRDDRAEAFSSLLWEGVYTYSYVARATTPGTFIAPPPRAEEMYAPETFGRGQTDRVVVR